MRKMIVIAVYLSSCMGSVLSQERVAATQEQQTMIEAKISSAAKKMNSMICDFEQVKISSLLITNAVSRGKMFYRTSTANTTSLRWEYADGYTFIYNNDHIQLLSAEGKTLNSVKMTRFFREIMNTMLMAVNGNGVADKNKFTATFYMDKNHWYVVLTPVQRELKNMFSVIELVFNANDCTGERVEITEKSEDKTIITLINKKLNVKIDDNKFLINNVK